VDAAPLVVVVVFREARSDRMRGESKTDKKKPPGRSWKTKEKGVEANPAEISDPL